MQTTDMRNGDDLALFRRFDGARIRSILVRRSPTSSRSIPTHPFGGRRHGRVDHLAVPNRRTQRPVRLPMNGEACPVETYDPSATRGMFMNVKRWPAWPIKETPMTRATRWTINFRSCCRSNPQGALHRSVFPRLRVGGVGRIGYSVSRSMPFAVQQYNFREARY
jgi:hypothetical protein